MPNSPLAEFFETGFLTPESTYRSFYPVGPEKSDSFSKIILGKNTTHIKAMIDGTKGTIVAGGDSDISKRYVAPTIVQDVRGDDSLMAAWVATFSSRRTCLMVYFSEIVGPVLPIVPVEDVDEEIYCFNARQGHASAMLWRSSTHRLAGVTN
ncbi:Fatty aldehyde dehydrogenase [Trametes pubescens]|uniref:Fatty aldehyde dehydrogenase n=1 Tax=Trametes pubescens TaxID=154538 RepID=A0A1M2VCH1_TRAPU|nr:Fatty aldehyde dehydrogenase [Trametes pubescens]